MQAKQAVVVTAGLGFCVLGILLFRTMMQHPQPTRGPLVPAPIIPRRPASPSEAALREARRRWGQAQMAVKPEMEALSAAHPDVDGGEEGQRRRLMARDRGGYLRRARGAAVRSVRLAKSREERYEATLWVALIECDQGHHAAELQDVRRLLAIHPRSPTSLGALRRAAKCNGLWRLAREADAALQAIAGDQPGVGMDRRAQQPGDATRAAHANGTSQR